MRPYVEWMRENIFWVKEWWDSDLGEMSTGDPADPGGSPRNPPIWRLGRP